MERIDKIKINPWYYPVVILGYILTLASGSVHPGLIASALLVVVLAESLLRIGLSVRSGGGLQGVFGHPDTMDILAAVWFVYNLLSVIWSVHFGMPVSVYAGEFSTGILTMVFYLAARITDEKDCDRFYLLFIGAVCLAGVVGVILYLWAPQFYLDYLYDHTYISKADVSTMRVRMISVVGSIQLGFLSVAGMLASARILLGSAGKKGKLLLLACCLFAFLSNQRSAMVAAILVLVYVNYLLFFTYRLLPKKYFVMECVGAAVLFVLLCIAAMPVIMKVYYRLVSLPGAIGQRSDQWVGAINNMSSLWLGNGLGANGHRAAEISEHVIADGGIAKLFVESGILGFSVFVYLCILAFKKGIRSLSLCAAEVGLVAVALLQSIGSNILTFQLATPVFWFAMGRIAYHAAMSGTEKPAGADGGRQATDPEDAKGGAQ